MFTHLGNPSTLELWILLATFVATCNVMGLTYWFLYKKTGNRFIALTQGIAFSILFSLLALGAISAAL